MHFNFSKIITGRTIPMAHYEQCHPTRRSSLRGGHNMADFRGAAVLLPADGVRVLLRPLLLRQERALLLAAGRRKLPHWINHSEFCRNIYISTANFVSFYLSNGVASFTLAICSSSSCSSRSLSPSSSSSYR